MSSQDPLVGQGEGEETGGRSEGESSRPFAPAPTDLRLPGKGCSRMALAGCGLVALVLGLGVLTMILKATDLVAWSLTKIRLEVERTLPDELPTADRERLASAFDAALKKIEEGELDPVEFQALQTQLMQFAGRSSPPTVDDVRALAAALEAFAADSVPPPPAPEGGARTALLVG